MGQGGTECSLGCLPNGQSLICNCMVLGARQLMSLLRGRGRPSFPNRCWQSPSGLSSSWECTQVALRDSSPNAALGGKRVLMERSGRVPDQWSQGPGGTSQRPYAQLSPECDTVASASLPLINKGRVGHDSIAKCCGDCGTLCASSLVWSLCFLVKHKTAKRKQLDVSHAIQWLWLLSDWK